MQLPGPIMNVPTQAVSGLCLYLNVWSPAKTVRNHVPVPAWVYGGGFAFGSTAMPLFDGAVLVRMGVVSVSITYRVGLFGFFTHSVLSAESPRGVSGSCGLLDQIAALLVDEVLPTCPSASAR